MSLNSIERHFLKERLIPGLQNFILEVKFVVAQLELKYNLRNKRKK